MVELSVHVLDVLSGVYWCRASASCGHPG